MSDASRELGKALEHLLKSEEGNLAEAVFALAGSVDRLASAVQRLGVNDAATQMGAVEMLGNDVKEGLENIAQAIDARGQEDG
jgi:hypothetical protein